MFICACLLTAGISSCGEGGGGSSIYHTVTFDSKGGSAVPAQSVAHGEKINKPEDPSKIGYSFDNWTYKGEAWSFVGHVVTEDMTLDANWSIINYNIIYELNGGYNSPFNPSTYNIESPTINLDNPVKDRCKFIGWLRNGSPIERIEAGSIGDITLTATWQVNVFDVRYELDGGTNNPLNPSTYSSDSECNLYAPSKEGYSFVGWTCDGQQIDKIPEGTTGNLVLVAHWSISSYNVVATSSDPSKGTVNGSGLFQYNSEVTVNATVNSGYLFVGWFYDMTYSVCLSDKLTYTFKMPGKEVSLIAYFVSLDEAGLTLTLNEDNQSYSIDKFNQYSISTKIKDLELPSSYNGLPITEIKERAFYGCGYLKSVTLGDCVQTIGEAAFASCSALKAFYLPNSIKKISKLAFSGCDSSVFNIFDNAYYLGNSTNPFIALIKPIDTQIETCDISNGCLIIADYAFESCHNLTSISIPESVISLGNNKSALSDISIYFHISSIEDFLKMQCKESVGYSYSDDVHLIDENNVEIKEVVVPDSITLIPDYAFARCGSLLSIKLGNATTRIGDYAFLSCTSLTSMTLPDCVMSIGMETFENCSSLETINFPKSLISVGSAAFYRTGLKFNGDLGTYLGDEENPYLILIESSGMIDSRCLIISGNSLYYAGGQIIIPDGVISIGMFAIGEYATSIIIPTSLILICDNAFVLSEDLNAVYYKGSQYEWENNISIGTNNVYLTDDIIYYYSETEPTEPGNYWHYENYLPVKW